MSDLVIEPFAPADQPAAEALILAGLEEHWGMLDASRNPDLNDIATSYSDGIFLVARLNGQIVGTGALIPDSDGIGRVVRMSVAKAHRRRGIASRMLAALLDQARTRGYDKIVLETTETWSDAIGFICATAFAS